MKNLFFLADTHLTFAKESLASFTIALQNLKKIDSTAALIHLGDIIDSGDAELFKQVIHLFQQTGWTDSLATLGNHDLIYSNGIPQNAWLDKTHYAGDRTVLTSYKTFFTHHAPMPYYHYETSEYLVYVLCTEAKIKESCGCYLSAQQLLWLEKGLTSALNRNETRPIFIISHQALNATHPHSNDYGGFGAEDSALKNILTTYNQLAKHPTFFISGHLHNGLNTPLLQTPLGILLDLPPMRKPRENSGLPLKSVALHLKIRASSLEFMPYFVGNTDQPNYYPLKNFSWLCNLDRLNL